ncbi:hypothetical protein EDI_174590 [Entamoeba dispar SAW760]|uniref:Uncharacterized protein n=1 Tax=Entamoeba dispar (strain ATCC PRA-260 / SAW760) TaxID=370354 RepID=B0EKN2_ENTDS|nr:uncharacterized protein EDI_174590 [Entamoeba dispar SAW760]EDR24931.1 hypothetical protein EDI_174590 [Entamoeba dispar SAW760]|eukprot:EDR24931.1 hypothetical protein EDI_174590 [Entamoeba dispar SAW760]
MITRPSNNQTYWVRFGPRDNQLVSLDKIKPFSDINSVQLSTVNTSKIKIRKLPKETITELPKWTKPKPNDTEKDLLLKRKKRHQLKSLMKQQKEEEDLETKKNSWKAFASKMKK